jgi:hypothetical protein
MWFNLKFSDSLIDSAIAMFLHRQFQNQPPIGWLKEYKIANKTLFCGTVT